MEYQLQKMLYFESKLTLNILDALVENLLKHLGVVQFGLNLGNDSISELLLLPLLDTLLVSNPRIQRSLGLSSNGSLLLELVGLSLKSSSFLNILLVWWRLRPLHSTNLGNLEKSLGDVDNTAEFLDAGNAILDSGSVVLSGRVEDARDLLVLALCPCAIGWTTVMSNSPENRGQAQCDNGLLVDDQELIADSCNGETGTCG